MLKNALDIETSEKGIISNKINNEVLMNRFKIYEVKENNRIFLHKRVKEYYIVLKFNEVKLKIDAMKIAELKNEHLKQVRSHMNVKDKMSKAINIEGDPEYQSLREQDYSKNLGEGDISHEKENFEVTLL